MVTVIECVSAAGCVLPPMYIYKGTQHLMGWHTGVEKHEETTYAYFPKGLADRELGLGRVELVAGW